MKYIKKLLRSKSNKPQAERIEKHLLPPAIKVGMSTDEVINLLGEPTAKTSTSEARKKKDEYQKAHGLDSVRIIITREGEVPEDKEYLTFKHPAGDYNLVILNGSVIEVFSQPKLT